MSRGLLITALLLAAAPADAREHRSAAVLREFQKTHPCPATQRATGPCPGWVKDHIRALACHGADSVENLQWQTAADANAKDKVERKGC
jgi:hypothetical protein